VANQHSFGLDNKSTHSRIKTNVLQHEINTRKLKPGLVASYDIWLGNGEGLFLFRSFINLSHTYLLRHLPTYLQPTWSICFNSLLFWCYSRLGCVPNRPVAFQLAQPMVPEHRQRNQSMDSHLLHLVLAKSTSRLPAESMLHPLNQASTCYTNPSHHRLSCSLTTDSTHFHLD